MNKSHPPNLLSDELLEMLKDNGALYQWEEGMSLHPELSSGMHASMYCNMRHLESSDPIAFFELCEFLATQLQNTQDKFDTVLGIDRGGVIPAFVVAQKLGKKFARTIKTITNQDLPDTPVTGRVLIVEDVVTTGKTAAEVADMLARENIPVVGFACLLSWGKCMISTRLGRKNSILLCWPAIKHTLQTNAQCAKAALALYNQKATGSDL